MSWQNRALKTFLRYRVRPLSKNGGDIEKIRAFARRYALKPRPPRGWRVRELLLPPLHGEWIEPDTDRAAAPTDGRVILYLHGGGYYFHSPRTYRSLTFPLARNSMSRVFALDYRLAPEHKFPAALDDAVACYRRLMMDGVPARKIVVAGDSAGGGLALALLVSLRDHGDPLPAGAVLFSPWTDLAATGATLETNNGADPMFIGSAIGKAAQLYLGAMPGTHPLASPLYAELGALPPLFVQASTSEVLLDDSVRMVEKARQAGSDVIFRAWPDLPHVWHLFNPLLPEARAALREASAFIRSRLT
ncbi:MAG TPA: alpha/beta hydrolase [Stellaceae bacterium]|jgi:acetyl esterase/lipase|nr:alpha/beta hydrolase [Stellaceae bacterium]